MEPTPSICKSIYRYTHALQVALGYRDLLTQLHSDRVCDLCMAIGERYGLPEDELGILKISAAFHDVGKIGIPDRVLLKSLQFDDAEWKLMKQHAEIGEAIMLATELEASAQAATVIRHHHEHFDGQGYPDGLDGDEIPIISRIISIADSYDAMAVTRSYHRAREHSEIMSILREETGKKHDPYLMDLFSDLIECSTLKASGS